MVSSFAHCSKTMKIRLSSLKFYEESYVSNVSKGSTAHK